MNIMKTNMLLLDNKIMKDDADSTVITAPVPTEENPEKAMKALSFQGLKNLMANPQLAMGVGVMNDKMEETSSADSYVAPYSTNVAFKANPAIAKTLAGIMAIASAGALTTSCQDKISQEQTVIVDTEAIAAAISSGIAALQAEINALKAQLAAQNTAQAERDAKLLEAMNGALNQLIALNATVSSIQTTVVDQNVLNRELIEAFKEAVLGKVDGSTSAIVNAIALLGDRTTAEAQAQVDRIIKLLETQKISYDEAIAQIQALLNTINTTIKNAAEQASKERADLLNVAKDIKANGKASLAQQQVMIAQLQALIENTKTQIAYQKKTIEAIEKASAKNDATIREVAKEIGMTVEDLAAIVARTGKSLEAVMKMSKAQILAELKKHTSQLETVNNKLGIIDIDLQNIDQSVIDNTGAVEKAADEILQALSEIKAEIQALSAQLASGIAGIRSDIAALASIANGIYSNGSTTNYKLDNLSSQLSCIGSNVSNLKQTAIEIRNNLINGVTLDTSQMEALLRALNLTASATREEVIARLDDFIAGQDRIEGAINNLRTDNNSKLDYIACLIKHKTNDNADVIEAINNLSQANEANIAAATEQLAAKLDVLIAKADAALNRMCNMIKLLKQYGDQITNKLAPMDDILAAIKANGSKLDIANMNLAQLRAEVEKIKPELQKLNASAVTANSYLDIIAKRQLELKQEIQNLQNIGGNSLTKEELEELWQKHDAEGFANAKAYLDAIHADDIAKADEIIEYLKKGNKIACNTYKALLDFANKNNLSQEELKKLLQAVYDYLPELKCHCNCQSDVDNNQHTDEGIIGIIS